MGRERQEVHRPAGHERVHLGRPRAPGGQRRGAGADRPAAALHDDVLAPGAGPLCRGTGGAHARGSRLGGPLHQQRGRGDRPGTGAGPVVHPQHRHAGIAQRLPRRHHRRAVADRHRRVPAPHSAARRHPPHRQPRPLPRYLRRRHAGLSRRNRPHDPVRHAGAAGGHAGRADPGLRRRHRAAARLPGSRGREGARCGRRPDRRRGAVGLRPHRRQLPGPSSTTACCRRWS